MVSLQSYPGMLARGSVSVREMLRGHPLYSDLTDAGLDALLALSIPHSFSKGDVLIRQGDKAETTYVLLSGRVSLMGERQDGSDTVVNVFKDGNIFLLTAIILDLPHIVGVEALEDIKVLSIPTTQFIDCMNEHPSLAVVAFKQLAGQTRMLVNQVKQLKLQSANERLANYILARCPRFEGSAIIELADDRRLIAQRLGMTPESLSRSIATLRDIGVAFEQRTVRIDDIAVLRKYSGLEIII